jgi:KUP system potassium uptake protein
VAVLGRTILHMGGEHNWFKRFVINHLYRFLQKNFSLQVQASSVPCSRLTMPRPCRLECSTSFDCRKKRIFDPDAVLTEE